MGSVAMGSGGSWIFEGYNITETAYCLYCDKCGSFKIMCWIPFPKWMGVVFFILIMVVARIFSWDSIITLCVSFSLLILSIFDSTRHLIHICKKCGNPHITKGNVLNYPEFDRNILDVQYEKTIKYYMED